MKNLIMLSLFLATTSIFAQNNLKGNVIDADTGSPIPFASVYIPTLQKGGNTNVDGEFILVGIPNGRYQLVISSIGFKSFSRTINLPEDGNITAELTHSAIEMDEVIVSTPFHKLRSENVMKVSQANVKKLKTQGAITLSDGISQVAGVETLSTGVGIGKPVIRGLSGNRVLVYTQGIRLENQQYGAEHGLGINDAGIESIEVIKGPASLLYGSDALGGVLYLNPEKFAPSNTNKADANFDYYSNTNGTSANAGFKTSADRFEFLIRGAHVSHADYESGNGLYTTNSRFSEYDLKTGFAYHFDNFQTELRYNYNHSEIGIPEEISVQNRHRTPIFPYQDLENHILSLKSVLYFDTSSLDIILGYSSNKRLEYEDEHHHEEEGHEEEEGHLEEDEHASEHLALDMRLRTLSYNMQYHMPKIGEFETIIGVQGMYQSNENFGEELLIPDASMTDYGVMATSHYHMENSDIQFGLRYDNRIIDTKLAGEIDGEYYFPAINKTYNSFNASAGYRFDFLRNFIGRINLASGFRAPNLSELTSNGGHSGANRYEIGNSELENEQNIQFDLSLEYNNRHVEVYVNGFYNNINNYIYLQPKGEFILNNPVYQYTQNDSKLYGGEMGLHLHPHPVDWLHFESNFEMVVGKLSDTDQYIPLIPANTLTNTLRLEFEGKKFTNSYTFLTLKSTFNQNKVGTFETPTQAYTLLNAGIGTSTEIFDLPVDFRITANNIFDTKYISHLSRLKTDGIYNIGRNINLGLTLTL
ncbi:TonB-dependent receptor [Galbibacter sp.]|uniref:TonB-dependent receptor n=1 Tax=Galbibacter sp. TaxID=2918471 RepID=UPI003A8E78C2